MTDKQIDAVAATLNRLPFVTWDRCITYDYDEGGNGVKVYGWIARDDGRSDFVLAHFESAWGWEPTDAAFTTSSAKHSEEIQTLLRGDAEGHIHCKRVSDVFGDRVEQVVGQSVAPAGEPKTGTGR